MFSAQPGASRTAIALAVGVALAALAAPAAAQDTGELRRQIEALQQKLDDLEKRQRETEAANQRKISELEKRPATAASGAAVTGGDIPGSFKLPGTNTSVKLGGYVKVDALYNNPQTGVNSGSDQLLNPASIPVGPAADAASDGFKIHARQTRLNLLTSTPTPYGPFTTFIEGDFFGPDGNEVVSNSHAPRLRHAWGTLGAFGGGQFWSNFMFTPSIPETIDFGGPVGTIFIRQAQVRWTQKFDKGTWSLSLENPEAVFGGTTSAATVRPDRDRFPDIVGTVQFDAGRAKLYLGGLVRNIRSDGPGAPSDDKWGAAVSFAGVVPTVGKDDIRFNLYGGNAVGRYQPSAFFVDGVLDANGQLLSLPKILGGFAAYRHFWREDLRSSLVLSASRADLPDGSFGTLNKADYSAHVNLIWSAWKDVNLGVEYIYAKREIENGQDGDLNRLQFSAQYNF